MKRIFNKISILLKKRYTCAVCSKRVIQYNPLDLYFVENLTKYGFINFDKTAETVNLKQYSCPYCNASDRDRLYALYLTGLFKSLNKNISYNFLDIAPSPPLSKNLFTKYPFIKRKTADLMANNVDDKIDIMDMNIYMDNFFDFFLCSHVLEHVLNPDKAMKELYRVLKKGGRGIVMVPIILGLDETLEDPNHKTEADRWKYYGQGDHLRQFGKKDFIKRLESSGFKVNQFGIDFFGKKNFKKNAIMEHSILYVVEK